MFRSASRSISTRFSYFNKSLFRGVLVDIFDVNEEVRTALQEDKPVVALESTIITHGMPYPENVKCAEEVEATIRQQGAVPATIAIMRGKIKVGLSQTEIEELGDIVKSAPIKTSRRDFSYVIGNKLNGGTTVSGTLMVANSNNIPVFATGGIGGVHRAGEVTFDISSDLIELGKSSVAVVSSGVKSILDIPKTLEFLETQGVFVATFCENRDFPAFYTRKSGCLAPYCVPSPQEAARIIFANHKLDLNSGMLFAVPVPEKYSLDEQQMNENIEIALELAKTTGISGKDVTPFLLKQIATNTHGKSLEANIALVKNNARVAADIAVELSKLKAQEIKEKVFQTAAEAKVPHVRAQEKKEGDAKTSGNAKGPNTAAETTTTSTPGQNEPYRPVLIGGSNLDCYAKLRTSQLTLDGGLYDVDYFYGAGGVGRNMAEAMHKLGCPPFLITAIGDDIAGRHLIDTIPKVCRNGIQFYKGRSSGQCHVLLYPNGECPIIFGDMSIHRQIDEEVVYEFRDYMIKSPMVILDANLSQETMNLVFQICTEHNVPLFYEPTDVSVAHKMFLGTGWKSVAYVSPNFNELRRMVLYLQPNLETYWSRSNLEEVAFLGKILSVYIDHVLVTLGEKGLLICNKIKADEPLSKMVSASGSGEIYARYYPAQKLSRVPNVSGAGDCFSSGLIHAILKGYSEEICVSVGFEAAKRSLMSKDAVPDVMFDETHECWRTPAKYVTVEAKK